MTLKLTRQQASVAEHLKSAKGFRSAQEIHAELRAQGSTVGLATVYRALQLLAEGEEVDVLRAADGEARYRACSPGHHHHLVCRVCGETREIEAAAVERWASKVGADNGFADITHDIELFGVCEACR